MKNEAITRISSQDGKPIFLPIYARFYHFLGMIDALDLTREKKLSIIRINVRLNFSPTLLY